MAVAAAESPGLRQALRDFRGNGQSARNGPRPVSSPPYLRFAEHDSRQRPARGHHECEDEIRRRKPADRCAFDRSPAPAPERTMLADRSSEGEVVMTGADEVGQPSLVINDPNVVKEVEAEFAAYYLALAANDVAALNRFFFDSPHTIRYGNAEVLYG